MRPALILCLLSLASSACARTPGLFSEQNARAHVGMLAGTIGSRPLGTPENQRAREYIADQLRLFGFDVRVQETDARRPELGRTARVANIIGILPGARRETIGLVAHYDSVPEAPGATDDALGVATVLEAARVFAARTDRQWSLAVLLTDGEEAGLMGAAALVTDRDAMDRLSAYVQIESIGSAGAPVLFETGPGNAWIVEPWARRAPHPRGGSYAIEIYQRLPNDTDFTILKRREIPGLNFAPVDDSYAYHTARDTPERLSSQTIRQAGENVGAILDSLNATDITRRSTATPTFFDLAETAGVTYGPTAGRLIAVGALVLGVLAWVRVTAAAIRVAGVLRWLLTFVWSALGAAAVVAAMTGATWALRASRAVYHPWYAYPDRLLILLVATGVVVGWAVVRLGQWLPARAHGLRHPVVAWSVTLPLWIALAAVGLFFIPAAAYLWTVPLLAAGLLLAIAPPASRIAIRAASVVILGVAATLWLSTTIDLARFVVATMGRLPLVTPIFVYPVLLALGGAMIVPPMAGAFVATRRLLRPSLLTATALLVLAVAAGAAYRAPAYTFDAPQRRTVRVLQSPSGPAVWEIGSSEPGLDLMPGAPGGWTPATGDLSEGGVPWGRLAGPFVFRTRAQSIGTAPIDIPQATLTPVAGGLELVVAVTPQQPGLTVSFALAPGVTPARHNLPGLVRLGSWTATYVAVPVDGVLFRAAFGTNDPAQVGRPLLLVSSSRIPGGSGWQSLPSWLPQERAVWRATATWAVPVNLPSASQQGTPPVAPVPALR